MDGNSTSSENRTRQACEPCRKKKTKCPAERPSCSMCQRAKQRCVYLPREQYKSGRSSGRIEKEGNDKQRIQMLESQVNELYRLVQSEFQRDVEPQDRQDTYGSVIHNEEGTSPRPADLMFKETSLATPSIEVLQQLVEVYATTLHFQPLPLFDPKLLLAHLLESPKHLLWNFLAATLTLSVGISPARASIGSADTYATLGRKEAMEDVSNGLPTRDLVQSLCLLALRDIMVCQPAKAWMSVGSASRLESLRRHKRRNRALDASSPDRDADLRCYWSVFLLERTFWAPLSDLPFPGKEPVYPLSALVPAPIQHANEYGPPTHLIDVNENIKDHGINKYCLEMVSIWGKVFTYIGDIRIGQVEAPWLPHSTYNKLCVELFDCEAQLSQRHLLRHVALTHRTAADLQQYQEYWRPWLIMQLISHAAPAILNHPFLHLVEIRGKLNVPTSRLFLQQTVDLALFHSGWVFRLISHCEDIGFHVCDPLIGHLVAATATIPWFFQFAEDTNASNRAKDDLTKCETLLTRMAMTWPHIRRKLEILQKLRSIASRLSQTLPPQNTSITFPPALIWKLLDPSILEMASHGDIHSLESTSEAQVRVTTRYVHPLAEASNEQQVGFGWTPDLDTLSARSMDIEAFDIGDLFSNFTGDNFQF